MKIYVKSVQKYVNFAKKKFAKIAKNPAINAI